MLVVRSGNSCLTIHNPGVRSGARVALVSQPDETDLNHEGPTIAEGVIVEPLTQPCDDKLGNGDNDAMPSYYRVDVTDGETLSRTAFAGLFVGILEPVNPISIHDGKAEGDLDGDGTKESFRTCTSNEGGHFQVWTGPPLDGKPRWHWYEYAGYDTEYTCTDRDYFGPKRL